LTENNPKFLLYLKKNTMETILNDKKLLEIYKKFPKELKIAVTAFIELLVNKEELCFFEKEKKSFFGIMKG